MSTALEPRPPVGMPYGMPLRPRAMVAIIIILALALACVVATAGFIVWNAHTEARNGTPFWNKGEPLPKFKAEELPH